jgi:hypothetical protein
LRIKVEDIYFLTGLSRRGEVVNLKARGEGSRIKIEEYIDVHCVAGTPKIGSQVPIQAINNLSLKIIVLVLTRIIGSALLYHASRPLMFYAVQCMKLTVYDWCSSLSKRCIRTRARKAQLIDRHNLPFVRKAKSTVQIIDIGVHGMALFRSRIRRGICACVNHRLRILSPTHYCGKRKSHTGAQIDKKKGFNSKFTFFYRMVLEW